MSNDFKWDDKTVKEFINFSRRRDTISDCDIVAMDIEAFKSSKAPKKEWEIVAYKTPFGNTVSNESGSFERSKELDYPIHSVRRLRDNLVFFVGGVFSFEGNIKCIKSFREIEGFMDIYFTDGIKGSINSIEKIKSPLFTTHDGKEIYEGDVFFRVMMPDSKEPWKVVKNVKAENMPYYTDNRFFKNFSTKKSAEQYCIENKPCLSVMDLVDVKMEYGDDYFVNLKELAKQKVMGK
jgi:hypothetical protein